MTLGFAITGSFCTIASAIGQMKILIDKGYEILPIMSEIVYKTDTKFAKAKDLTEIVEKLTDNKIIHSIKDAEPIGPENFLDALVIAPCTGNTLSKIANGINDTSVTMAAKAHVRNNKPIIFSIATNDALSANAKNLGVLLNSKNVYFVPFVQDDYTKKPNSIVADITRLPETVEEAVNGRQIEPILWR